MPPTQTRSPSIRREWPVMPKNSVVEKSGKIRSFSLANVVDAIKSNTNVTKQLEMPVKPRCFLFTQPLPLLCGSQNFFRNAQPRPGIRTPRVKNDITNLLYKFAFEIREGERE